MFKSICGEFVGTFILVFIGCGALCLNSFLGLELNLLQIAIVWGLGVCLAIFISREYSKAFLNPAVTYVFYLRRKINAKELILYSVAQLFASFVAAFVLFVLFHKQIHLFEAAHGIVRGTYSSSFSANVFGEFFSHSRTSPYLASMLEALGTFILVMNVLLIVRLLEAKRILAYWIPILVGLTVTCIIILIGPYTQAGINPARDLGPRLFASFAGWGKAAFDLSIAWTLCVYVVAPYFGAGSAYAIDKIIFKNNINKKG